MKDEQRLKRSEQRGQLGFRVGVASPSRGLDPLEDNDPGALELLSLDEQSRLLIVGWNVIRKSVPNPLERVERSVRRALPLFHGQRVPNEGIVGTSLRDCTDPFELSGQRSAPASIHARTASVLHESRRPPSGIR